MQVNVTQQRAIINATLKALQKHASLYVNEEEDDIVFAAAHLASVCEALEQFAINANAEQLSDALTMQDTIIRDICYANVLAMCEENIAA